LSTKLRGDIVKTVPRSNVDDEKGNGICRKSSCEWTCYQGSSEYWWTPETPMEGRERNGWIRRPRAGRTRGHCLGCFLNAETWESSARTFTGVVRTVFLPRSVQGSASRQRSPRR